MPIVGNMGTTYAGEFNPNDYSQPPQNVADAVGFRHDLNYDRLGLQGPDGVWDSKSTPANLQLVRECLDICTGYWSGATDVYTGKKISKQTFRTALAMMSAFYSVEKAKQVKQKNQQIQFEYNSMQQQIKENPYDFWSKIFNVPNAPTFK
jgi:hypothetical protein